MENKRPSKKRIIVIQSLKYTLMFGVGYYFGVKAGGEKFNKALETLALTGLTASKMINGRNYILSIDQEL